MRWSLFLFAFLSACDAGGLLVVEHRDPCEEVADAGPDADAACEDEEE
jgi:hypothetical protein